MNFLIGSPNGTPSGVEYGLDIPNEFWLGCVIVVLLIVIGILIYNFCKKNSKDSR